MSDTVRNALRRLCVVLSPAENGERLLGVYLCLLARIDLSNMLALSSCSFGPEFTAFLAASS